MASYSHLGVRKTKHRAQCMAHKARDKPVCIVNACIAPMNISNGFRVPQVLRRSTGTNTHSTRLLAKTTIASTMTGSLAVVVASSVLAAANLGTYTMLRDNLVFVIFLLAAAASTGTLMTAWQRFIARRWALELFVVDIH